MTGEKVDPIEPMKEVEPVAEVIPMGDTVYAFRFAHPLPPEAHARLANTIKSLDLPFRVIVLGPEVEIFKLDKC